MEVDKIYCGDCLDVLPTIVDNSVDLVIADIPYNEGKAEWDKIKNYFDYIIPRIKISSEKLKETGSFYVFHMNFKVFTKLINKIERETDLIFRQFITIHKGINAVAGRCSPNMRSYPKATEYLAFFTYQDETGLSKIQPLCMKPMANYLKSEIERANVSFKEIAKLFPSKTGGVTGCVSNWIIGYNYPLKWQYEKIRDYLNKTNEYEYLRKEYEDLRKEYEDLRKEYEDLRYTFNLPLGVTDVWDIDFYSENGKYPHPTKKPLKLIERIIKSSSKKGDVVLDPFAGVMTSAIACKRLNRHYICIEIDETYFNIGLNRIANVPEKLEKWGEIICSGVHYRERK